MQLRATLRGPAAGRAAGAMLARVVGALPPERRFDAAVRLARVLMPMLRVAPTPAGLRPSKLDSPTATALALVLNQLHRRGILFTPRVEVDGDPGLLIGKGQGVLVVAPYSKLNSLGIRFFYEQNPLTRVVTATNDAYQVLGSRATVPHLVTTPAFMVSLRHALAANALVIAMIETEADARRAVEFPTAKGPMYASDGLIRFAARFGVPLAFSTIALTPGGALRIVLRAPDPQAPRTVERDVAAYIGFVQELAAAAV